MIHDRNSGYIAELFNDVNAARTLLLAFKFARNDWRQ